MTDTDGVYKDPDNSAPGPMPLGGRPPARGPGFIKKLSTTFAKVPLPGGVGGNRRALSTKKSSVVLPKGLASPFGDPETTKSAHSADVILNGATAQQSSSQRSIGLGSGMPSPFADVETRAGVTPMTTQSTGGKRSNEPLTGLISSTVLAALRVQCSIN